MPFSKARSVEAAGRALKRGQYGKAVEEYQRIVQADPEDIRSKLKLGDLHIRASQTDDAIRVLREVAEHYGRQGFMLKAVAVYKQILKLDPQLPEVSETLASHYHQQGLLTEAVKQYKDAAREYARTGRMLERLEVIRKMVELDAENVADRIRLAEAFSAAGRYTQAVTLFREACRVLERRDRPVLYCKVAERLLHHQPDDFEVNRALAAHYLKERDAQRALPKLRACYRQQPRDLDVLEMLASTFDLLGQAHKAISVLREIARLHGENGLLKERDRTYERILELNSGDSEARKALDIATAVDDEQLVLEFDEEKAAAKRAAAASPKGKRGKPTKAAASSGGDDIEVVELDESAFVEDELPVAEAEDTPLPVDVLTADTERDLSSDARSAADAVEAVRRDITSLDEIFGDLDLDQDIDIQEDGEDTIDVGEMAIDEFDEFEFDDELERAPGAGAPSTIAASEAEKRPAPKPVRRARNEGQKKLESDWKELFGDDPLGDTGDFDDAFGRVEEEVDLDKLLAEAEKAVVKHEKPAGAKKARARKRPAPAKPAPAAARPATAQRPAPAAGIDVALRESLEEVDFYVSNELTEDAAQLLSELRNEYPEHPEIVRRLKALGRF